MSDRSRTDPSDGGRDDVRERIVTTAQALFYERGVRAVGIDLIIAEAHVAKASLYRHFATKDDLVAAFLDREDGEFWGEWDGIAHAQTEDAAAELDALIRWISERIVRPHYRGCPQLNVAAEFPDPDHPARRVATDHKRELRRRLEDLASRIGVDHPKLIGGQLAMLINGAFVSSSMIDPREAHELLRGACDALLDAPARRQPNPKARRNARAHR